MLFFWKRGLEFVSEDNQHTTKVFNVATALSDAQRIIREAEKRAAEMIREAEDAAVKAREAGYAAGFEEGQSTAVGQAVRMLGDVGRLRVHIAEEVANPNISSVWQKFSLYIELRFVKV